ADYAADQPQVLADLVIDADEKQFAIIYPKFKDLGERGLLSLASESKPLPITTDWTVRFYKWKKGGKHPADWEAVLKSPVLDELRVSQLSFHGAKVSPAGPTEKVPHEYFAAVATSEVTLEDDVYYLTTTFDDGVRVWLDNAVVFENWGANNSTTESVSIRGRRGRHNVKVEYFQVTGGYVLDVGSNTSAMPARRRAYAAVALLKMNQPSKVWPLLKHSPDPSVRSYLIHSFAPLCADVMTLVHRLDEETDVSIRRALILSLGEFDTTQFPVAQRQPLIAKLLDLYRNDPDPGLHGAAEWLLRQKDWDQEGKLAEIDAQLRVDEKQLQSRKVTEKRQWYVSTEGQTFVILNADKVFVAESFYANRAANLVPQRIGRTFAIASKIVTESQYRHFQHASLDFVKLEAGESSRTDDSPHVLVSWYAAAQYCNWLSNNEGIPKEQWCYEPNAQGRYADGMKPATDYLKRSGYRLPTEAEWEYACRSGTETSRYYGQGVQLLTKYGWFSYNSQGQLWPVGLKKPNDYGLFDMIGNAWQWCDDAFEHHRVLEDLGTRTAVRNDVARTVRGGSYTSPEEYLQSDVHFIYGTPGTGNGDWGFRPARTLP
ncbi:MAG: SUMF1/EgtB/PvdO family nonheme iron enzyme, partial [Thermoguttaceae bacterium]